MIATLMKAQPHITRLVRRSTWIGLLISIIAGVGCTTTYDSAGRPVQSVDPGAAVAGAAAAGILGYAIGQNNDRHDRHDNYRNGGYYRGRTYHRSTYGHRNHRY